ncbi:MAG: glycosyltransferase [Anaerolineaceae bacterium]|nr:glycosyltransferase [Anaerolineaceae bacterium]
MNTHILLIADGRSAITKRWIDMLHSLEYRVSLVSTYPLTAKPNVEQIFILPVAFSAAGEESKKSPQITLNKHSGINWRKSLIQHARPIAMSLRYLLGPTTLSKYQQQLLEIISESKPDLVHALRIPYEGMLASITPQEIPLLISIWGNDFTLHANANRKMKNLTEQVMQRADGVLADVYRDISLAHQWGFSENKPALVVPGGGGILFNEIEAAKKVVNPDLNLPADAPVIVNPRGIRAYAQTDVFFQSIPLVLEKLPNAIFLCPGMKDKPEAHQWVERLGINNHVLLFPTMPQDILWSTFHRSQISVSITTHDGTPNTLLETMACGCFPIVGDIESLREWITPGVNGFLVSPHNPKELSEAIVSAINNSEIRQKAKKFNKELLIARADADLVRDKLASFYMQF